MAKDEFVIRVSKSIQTSLTKDRVDVIFFFWLVKKREKKKSEVLYIHIHMHLDTVFTKMALFQLSEQRLPSNLLDSNYTLYCSTINFQRANSLKIRVLALILFMQVFVCIHNKRIKKKQKQYF